MESMDRFRRHIPELYCQVVLDQDIAMVENALGGVIGAVGEANSALSSMASGTGGAGGVGDVIRQALKGVKPEDLQCTDVADNIQTGLSKIGVDGEWVKVVFSEAGGEEVARFDTVSGRLFTVNGTHWGTMTGGKVYCPLTGETGAELEPWLEMLGVPGDPGANWYPIAF
ncbi:MAG TPA: hypothetical protein VGM37_07515 [Armatimonadota bacterium]|jgi:hypothetical protein